MFKIKKKEIENFFNTIKECYTLWIDAKTSEALEKFEDLLKTRGLIYKEEAKEKDVLLVKDIDKQVFFRGRKSDEFLGKRDMFHVPYNKRYNLRNERFSLTGQPILYLGNTIADIVEELDIDLNDKDAQQCLKVSSFEIKDGEKRNKIFACFPLTAFAPLPPISCSCLSHPFENDRFYSNFLPAFLSHWQKVLFYDTSPYILSYGKEDHWLFPSLHPQSSLYFLLFQKAALSA